MREQLPLGIQKPGDVLNNDVWPDLKRKRDDWRKEFAEFEREQSMLFDELCREKGVLKV